MLFESVLPNLGSLAAETAVWPIPFLINTFTALKGSQFHFYFILYLNALLVTRQIGNTSSWVRQEGNQSLALTRDANLDTKSPDISAEEIKKRYK